MSDAQNIYRVIMKKIPRSVRESKSVVPRAAALGAAATVLSQLLHAVCDAAPAMYEPCIA